MKDFEVIIMPDAEQDFISYIYFIRSNYDAPITAKRHYEDISKLIFGLSKRAESCPIQTHKSIVDLYGPFVRRINYKKMAILYTIHGNTVYILRIIAQSMISDL